MEIRAQMSPTGVSPCLCPRGILHLFFSLLPFTLGAQNITTVVGGGELGDGANAAYAWLFSPAGLALDSRGNLYIADPGNHRVRMVGAAGMIHAVAGTGVSGWSGDNGAATDARLFYPWGVAVDSNDNLYIADTGNHRIRRVDAQTGIITTAAGSTQGDDDGTPGKLKFPRGVAVDSSGVIYVADTGNCKVRSVTAGVVATLAGTGVCGLDSNADGTATQKMLKDPLGVAVRVVSGNVIVYVADSRNDIVRKISSGQIATIAGNPNITTWAPDGSPATTTSIPSPRGVAVDSAGNVFVALPKPSNDWAGCGGFIRRIDSVGIIHTVVGPTTYISGVGQTPI